MFREFKTVWLLALVNAIAMSASPLMMLIGSIVGVRLSGGTEWATLPIAMMVIGTACAVIPAARGMARFGRKWTFLGFVTVGFSACFLASNAIALESFALFCLGAFMIGCANAALQQVRFAAMETVPLEKGPTAASIIMCAGIIAAFLGPELALAGQHLTSVEYQASFWLGMGCFLCGGVLLLFYTPAERFGHAHRGDVRSWSAMLASPTLLLAVASGAIAFAIMSFVMTATPISMHMHHGHSMADTKWVIQSHIAAMFLPSLVTAWLFKAFSIRGMMMAGLACYGTTIVIGLVDVSVIGFWGQLVMLGVGWNFLFVAGTAMLPTAYREGEQYRAQALNDSVIFSTQAAASLSAGWAISVLDWQAILLLCLVPVALMIVALLTARPTPAGLA